LYRENQVFEKPNPSFPDGAIGDIT
jgi:hypothetical protein